MIANTPQPPYYAVIFTNTKNEDTPGYAEMSQRMVELAEKQPGFLGIEHAGDRESITVSYWKDLESIRNWKMHPEHMVAQKNGQEMWYKTFKTRVCKVERG